MALSTPCDWLRTTKDLVFVLSRILIFPSTHRAVESGVLRALSDGPPGDVLVFLPGLAEIRRAQRLLEGSRGISGTRHVIHVLHGSLAMEDQDVALRPDPQGRTKIILSSPIAESSLTIPGVRSVVDAGKILRGTQSQCLSYSRDGMVKETRTVYSYFSSNS